MKKTLTGLLLIFAIANLSINFCKCTEKKEVKEKKENRFKDVQLEVKNGKLFDSVTFKLLFKEMKLTKNEIKYFYFDPKKPLKLDDKLIQFSNKAIKTLESAQNPSVRIEFYDDYIESDPKAFSVEFSTDNGLTYSNKGISIKKLMPGIPGLTAV